MNIQFLINPHVFIYHLAFQQLRNRDVVALCFPFPRTWHFPLGTFCSFNCDGYQYETKPVAQGGRGYAELLFFPTAEGYVKTLYKDDLNEQVPAAYQYIYIYKDHLGNNRLSYTLDPQTEQVKILEENHYYPFGLKHGSYNNTKKEVKYKEELAEKKEVKQVMADKVAFKYKYNGKELQDELGLNWYDYGARNYQADLGRWFVIDAFSEVSSSMSPYKYGFNNPVMFLDPDGNWEVVNGGYRTSDTGEISAFMNSLGNYSSRDTNKSLDIYVAGVGVDYSKKEVKKTEEVLTYLFGYSTLKTIDLPRGNGKWDWNDLANSLKGLSEQGYSFNSFMIDGHGYYSKPAFYLGSDKVTEKNYQKTSVLKNYFKNSSVYILACHVGGGKDPSKSSAFVQNLSNLWSATVYANRSWTPMSVFDVSLKTLSNKASQKIKPNAVKFYGQWLRATPGNKAPTIIKNLQLHPYYSYFFGLYKSPGINNSYDE